MKMPARRRREMFLAKADCSLKFVLKYLGPTRCHVCWLLIHRSGTKKVG
jgi:hypothetical protein